MKYILALLFILWLTHSIRSHFKRPKCKIHDARMEEFDWSTKKSIWICKYCEWETEEKAEILKHMGKGVRKNEESI